MVFFSDAGSIPATSTWVSFSENREVIAANLKFSLPLSFPWQTSLRKTIYKCCLSREG